MQERPAQHFEQDAGLTGQGGSSGRPAFFRQKRPQNKRRSRATAPADLEPPKGFIQVRVRVIGLGSGLGLGWSRPACKVEIEDTINTCPAQSFVQDNKVFCRTLLHMAGAELYTTLWPVIKVITIWTLDVSEYQTEALFPARVGDTVTGDHCKQDPWYTQKPIYLRIFTHTIWSYLRWSPVILH